MTGNGNLAAGETVRASRNGRCIMPGTLSAAELQERIALARRNLAALTEQAAAFSGAADEELAAQRIATQQKLLDDLLQQQEEQRRQDRAG
ncbi:hypothetical protein GCM10019059_20530 [Camelimonas fluminis]|nr:hypothetical protein GCM10019059_20530 [Camelimonas fluminis]